ncbi:MAG: acylphosphatase, partial [Dehalococcoidia bacterium]|nr:acylphosphatase [Dehalococcoidia bacterium]
MAQVKVAKLAKISVRGVVQGVGFRPFVYRLAQEHNLKGWVRNTSGSVEIEVEGDEATLEDFLSALEAKAPPMARIEQVEATFYPAKGYTEFEIWESLSQEGKYQLVSPDIAICEDCEREIFSATDRRFRYPFTNCTNCGPRFTIIEDIPYD